MVLTPCGAFPPHGNLHGYSASTPAAIARGKKHGHGWANIAWSWLPRAREGCKRAPLSQLHLSFPLQCSSQPGVNSRSAAASQLPGPSSRMWVGGSRKQTTLSRPDDAALCGAAIAAPAQLRTPMTNADVNGSLGYLTPGQMPQSTFFDITSTSSCVPPPESPVVCQRVVEPEGLASASFGVASGQCHRAPALVLRACRASFTD